MANNLQIKVPRFVKHEFLNLPLQPRYDSHKKVDILTDGLQNTKFLEHLFAILKKKPDTNYYNIPKQTLGSIKPNNKTIQ